MILSWDLGALARGLGLTVADVLEFAEDGRNFAFVLERRLARELSGVRTRTDSTYDLDCPDFGRCEVRAMTLRGINFAPSCMKGAGRSISLAKFREKLGAIDCFLVVDMVDFPRTPVYAVPSAAVRGWKLRADLGLRRDAFLKHASGSRGFSSSPIETEELLA